MRWFSEDKVYKSILKYEYKCRLECNKLWMQMSDELFQRRSRYKKGHGKLATHFYDKNRGRPVETCTLSFYVEVTSRQTRLICFVLFFFYICIIYAIKRWMFIVSFHPSSSSRIVWMSFFSNYMYHYNEAI